MKYNPSIIFLIVVLCIAESLATPDTAQNHTTCDEENGFEYQKCGSACPATCKNPNPKPCTAPCFEGCFCKKHLVLINKKKCVPLKQCPPKCGENEKRYPCRICEGTCKHPHPNCAAPRCHGRSGRGICQCKPGYVRDFDGKCIDKSCCPKCPSNQEPVPCHHCNPTCTDHPCIQPRIVHICRKGGKCGCKKGFVLLTPNSTVCIPETKCPKCPKNMQLYPCNHCDPTCSDPTLGCHRCPKICTKGECICGCKKGYVLKHTNSTVCIPVHKCFHCSEDDNEQFYLCVCDSTCKKHRTCPPDCYKPGCGCIEDYVRNKKNKCIKKKKCPKIIN